MVQNMHSKQARQILPKWAFIAAKTGKICHFSHWHTLCITLEKTPKKLKHFNALRKNVSVFVLWHPHCNIYT